LCAESVNQEPCQVDFYLLGASSPSAEKLACRLALMAWERKQQIYIVTATTHSVKQLDELMWQYPEDRFLPHASCESENFEAAPVKIDTLSGLKPSDVVINLCPEAIPQPERFSRVLEIVPYANEERKASRTKFKTYRNLGLKPQTHEINL
jgi:DNA polymerase-3 subunit chi